MLIRTKCSAVYSINKKIDISWLSYQTIPLTNMIRPVEQITNSLRRPRPSWSTWRGLGERSEEREGMIRSWSHNIIISEQDNVGAELSHCDIGSWPSLDHAPYYGEKICITSSACLWLWPNGCFDKSLFLDISEVVSMAVYSSESGLTEGFWGQKLA